MLGSTAALHLFNVVWPIGRRAASSGAADRYEYRSASDSRSPAGEAGGAADTRQDPPPGRALRPAPPAWRACRVDMLPRTFLYLVCGWAGAVLLLLATVLVIRLAG